MLANAVFHGWRYHLWDQEVHKTCYNARKYKSLFSAFDTSNHTFVTYSHTGMEKYMAFM